MTRAFLALVLGVLGFLTGFIAVWVFSDLPGVPIPQGTSFWVGGAMGMACLAAGYRYGDETLDVLGNLWDVLWKLSLGILDMVRSMIR